MVRSEPPGDARSSQRPLLARWPLLGLALAAAGGLLFTLLALNLRRTSRLALWDEAACQAMHRRSVRHSAFSLAVMRLSAALGREWAFLLTLLLGFYALLRRRWRLLAMVVVGVIGGNSWFVVLSRFFKRRRPVFPDPFHTVAGPGFPSGHSITSVTLYGLLFYLMLPRWRSWRSRLLGAAPMSAIILLVGYSRVYLGDHYPMDVLGGYGFGLFWGALVYTSIDLMRSRKVLCP